MKALLSFSLMLSFLFSSEIIAQNIQGIATYKTQRKMEIQLDSSMADGMQEQLMAMLKKQFEKEYTLDFTQDESVYKEVPKLDSKGNAMGGMEVQMVFVGDGASDVLYKNMKEDRFVNQNESFSKQFLIKDALTARDWKMEKETKNIGEYACFKATYTYERPVPRVITRSSDDTEEEKKEQKEAIEAEEEMETITVTAWYTPQIPVQSGPGPYGGLPGLILEVSDSELTVLCSKVVLNPSNGVDVKEPKGGKVVSQEEFDKIMDKKMKEMNENFEGDGRRRGDGNSVEIRIGG
ncbi:MAG: GLPGLI family protein [Bacteroidota bacterium]